MEWIRKNLPGIIICLIIALPARLLGKHFSIVGGAVIAIVAGMIIALFWNDKKSAGAGIKFTSKFILQAAVVLLGFGMNLNIVLKTGGQSLPIIMSTVCTSWVIAWGFHKFMHIPSNISILVGVGSSICGGSAIAATAPVIEADDDEVAQAISVIFFFNLLAAILFPMLGNAVGFSTANGEAFGIFAGTAVNDTSSVTAAASTWDSMWNLGSQTLDKAVTVKLTRTLVIIPVTLVLGFLKNKKAAADNENGSRKFNIKRVFPTFILYFLLASLITSIALYLGVSSEVFRPLKELSKFFIVMAMAAIGLGSNVVKLIKSGKRPILLGACCWIGITLVSLLMQHISGLW